MKIVFFGSDAVSIPALLRFIERGIEVAAVVTNPDAPSGRGKRLKPTEPKRIGRGLGIEVLQPERLRKNLWLREKLKEYNADLFAVLAYGKIIPPSIFNIPSKGAINLHFSLLPALRGAAPVRWAILKGIRKTGATVFLIDKGMDTGPILSQIPLEIYDHENYGEAMNRIAQETADFFVDTAIKWAEGKIDPIPQEGEPSYAPKIDKVQAALSFKEPAEHLWRKIRAFNPDLKPWFPFRGGRLIVLRAGWRHGEGKAGEIIGKEGEKLLVGTGRGIIELHSVQLPGKKPVSGIAFANGARLKPGDYIY